MSGASESWFEETGRAVHWYDFTQTDPHVLVPFAGYLVAVLVIAILAHRHRRTASFESEYYVAGRGLGAWVLALSWVATMFSGGAFIGYPSLIYSYGWTVAFWVSGSIVTALVGLGIAGKRINRLARQTGALTLVDLLRDRFRSNAIGILCILVIIPPTLVYLIAQFAAGTRVLQAMLGTTYPTGLVLFTLSVVAYTTYGGFRAVAWTDTLQGIVMIAGILVLVPLAVSAAGGLESATRQLATRDDPMAVERGLETARHSYLFGPGPEKVVADDPGALPEETPKPDPWLPFSMGISLFLLRPLSSVLAPTTVPRMLAFRDTAALRRALILIAPYFLLMYGGSLIAMNCAYSLDLGLSPLESDQVVPELAKRVAPPLLAGLLIAAPFAAVMSTVDSALLVISASVVRDIVQKTWYPRLSEKSVKALIYAVTGGAGVLVFVLTLLIEPVFLQPLVIHYGGAVTAALFWPGIATLFWKRATREGVIGGLAAGPLVYLFCVVRPPFAEIFPMHPFVYGFFGSALTVYLGSILTMPQDRDQLARYFGADSAG